MTRRRFQPPRFRDTRSGAVALLFAIALVPMLIMIGLAVNYGMYAEAQSQLDMAADAAAMHAARVAAQLLQQNDPACESKGEAAGTAWFMAQQGLVPQAKNVILPIITVSCATNATSVTATVNYSGVILASFGKLIPANWPGKPNWNIVGAATAVISNPSYVEVLMLLDNSSSMMIAATQDDIARMQQLTPCSSQAATEGQTIDYDYSWAYAPTNGGYTWYLPGSAASTVKAPHNASLRVPYGYGTFVYLASGDATVPNNTPETYPDIIPPFSNSASGASVIGQCDMNFTGPSAECAYPGYILNPKISAANGVSANGQCLNGKGGPGSFIAASGYVPSQAYINSLIAIQHTPQAPCAFACHSDQTGNNNDYWGLAESANPKITLRYNLLQDAAANVITTMAASQSVSRLSVGVYQFNAPFTTITQPNGVIQVYPAASNPTLPNGEFAATEAGAVTQQAETLTQGVLPPITRDKPDTNFENAMSLLGGFVKPAGAGNYPAAPTKNLFIVTDGMDDYYPNPSVQTGRKQGPITSSACNQLKAEGFSIYVLYTQYFPLANPYYLQNDKVAVEDATPATDGLTPIEYAMRSCASGNDKFYEATPDDPTSIDKALQAMLAAALGSAGRLKS